MNFATTRRSEGLRFILSSFQALRLHPLWSAASASLGAPWTRHILRRLYLQRKAQRFTGLQRDVDLIATGGIRLVSPDSLKDHVAAISLYFMSYHFVWIH
jgi:hypothetical protein